jgi:hypothetical protein
LQIEGKFSSGVSSTTFLRFACFKLGVDFHQCDYLFSPNQKKFQKNNLGQKTETNCASVDLYYMGGN